MFTEGSNIPVLKSMPVNGIGPLEESSFEQGQRNIYSASSLSTADHSKLVSPDTDVFVGSASRNEGLTTHGTAEEIPKANQKRRKRKVYRVVRVSCVNCRQSKQACDEFRPCARCIRLGLEELCVDAPSSRPRPLSSQIPTPNDKLFPKVQIHKDLDRLSSAGRTISFGEVANYPSETREGRCTSEISQLLAPLFSNSEHLRDSFISRYYTGEGKQIATMYRKNTHNLETESMEDTVLEAVYELSKMMILWDQELQTREHQANTKEQLEDTAKSHALFCYVLKVLRKFFQLWGVESFSDGGKRTLSILQSLESLPSAKRESVARICAYLPVRKIKLTADQQHEFLANIPVACLKMSLRVDESFHTVDFANKEACDLLATSEEELSILIGCRETLPIVMGGVDWIQKPMLLLRLLTENTLKRVEVYNIVTFDGSLYKCNVSCSVLLGDNWEPDSYIFLLRSAERLGHDPLAGAFLQRMVSRVKSNRVQNNTYQPISASQNEQQVFASDNMSKECYPVSSSTVLHM